MDKCCLAIDIGASSGRHIVGLKSGEGMITDEVYRFKNGAAQIDGHLSWDIESLLHEVKRGIDLALKKYPDLSSLSIDTWGVDYVLLKNGKALLPVYAYRDERTLRAVAEVHSIVPFSEFYRRTGCQFQPFNTVYQLYADKLSGRLSCADDMLMIPEYLLFRLCGARVREYTNATTTGLVSAVSGQFDDELIDRLGLPQRLFPSLSMPPQVIGEYKGIKCVICATHDTASAVEGIPMEENSPYISSGTWSLLGIKTSKPLTDELSEQANFSNEGGVGYNRYQKNIMGMWLINRLREELCPEKGFSRIIDEACMSRFEETVDANADVFMAPESMRAAFDGALKSTPRSEGDYFRCAYRSLAFSYKNAVEELERNTHKRYEKLYIVGGGARNDFLNRLTEDLTGKTVVALPIEATALGNLKLQMEVLG